jgi:hypothetical protein
MSSPSRTKRFLASLVERNPDTLYVKDWVVLRPVNHVFRAVALDRTSMKGVFRPIWTMSDMLLLRTTPGMEEFLFYAYPIGREEFWALTEPDKGKLIAREMDRTTLPFLRTIDSLEKYYWHRIHNNRIITAYPPEHFRLELAMGHFDLALSLANDHRESWFGGEEVSDQTRQLVMLLDEGNYSGIAQVLRECEAATARNFRIEHIWEPTPFAFEAA